MHAGTGGYLCTSVGPLRSPFEPGCPSRPMAEQGSVVPLPLSQLIASPTQRYMKNKHENLQQILKADGFFLLPLVTCKGRLWVRPLNASFAHQNLQFCHFVLGSCHGVKSHPLLRASAIAADEGQLLSKMDWLVLSCW